jgi:uncharacterized membrane protein (DUF485 family)
MSNLNAILLMLATLLFAAVCTNLYVRRMHQRCDEVATGFANDRPISVQYRWTLLYQDYVGNGFGAVLLLAAVATGFVLASGVVSDPNVKNVAYICAGVSGWAALALVLMVVAWIVRLVSILRQAEQAERTSV